MCGGSCKCDFRVLQDGIEESLKLLKRVLRDAIARTKPNASDDGFFYPVLILFSEEPDIDHIVKGPTGCDITVDG